MSAKDDKAGTAKTATGPAGHRALSIDYALYEKYLDDESLSEADRQEFLEALWSIIVSFVDLGFRVHPLQECCGQPATPEHESEADMVGSKDIPIAQPFSAAACLPGPAAVREES